MNNEKITNQLLEFIVDTYMVELNDIPLDSSLIDEGIIDSIGLFEVSSFLNKQFSITVLDEDIVVENFGSVEKITEYVKRKLSE